MRNIKNLFEQVFLTEMPWETIDYEIERFLNKSENIAVRYEKLKNFLKYLIVGDTYESEKQPLVNLGEIREQIIEDIIHGSLKLYITKHFNNLLPNNSYNDLIKEIFNTAKKDEKITYLQNFSK